MITRAKKLTLTALAVATFGMSSAFAIPQVKMGLFDAGSSGNFRAGPNAELTGVLSNYALGKSTDGTWFGTFCLEKNEYFSNGGIYDVALNNGTINGGVSGAIGGKDVISIGTAFLYEKFALGALSGFNYGTSLSARQLQNTIWFLEGEITDLSQGYTAAGWGSFLTSVQGLANYKSNYTGSAVQVMNLTSNGGRGLHQDQLVYRGVPDSGASLSLLLLGLTGLVVVRRRLTH